MWREWVVSSNNYLPHFFSISCWNYSHKKRHWSERIFWTFVVITSIAVCSYLIYNTWLKWQNTPVIVTFSEKSTPVYEIPFPSVTICTDIKIRKTNFDYGQVWHELNDAQRYRKFPNASDVEKLYVLSPLCDKLPKYLNDYIEMNDLSATLADADEQFYRLAKRYAPALTDVLQECKWRRDPINCSDIFNEVLTDDGICFSFNLLNSSELYHEEFLHEHYHVTRHDKPSYYWNGVVPSNLNEDMIYPRRVLTGSEGLRFELILPMRDKDYVCSGPVQSFKIQLHSSYEHPQMHRNFYRYECVYDCPKYLEKSSKTFFPFRLFQKFWTVGKTKLTIFAGFPCRMTLSCRFV